MYGPYVGHYHKYSAAELKKAMTADGKVKFTMKPVVKLVKGNKKGGLPGGPPPPASPAAAPSAGTYGEKLNPRKVMKIKDYIAKQGYGGTFYIIKNQN